MAGALRGVTHLRLDPWRLAGVALPLALVVPLCAGLLGVLMPAFGIHPGLGEATLSLAPMQGLLADASFPRAVSATLISGLGASVLAVAAAFAFCAAVYHTAWFARVRGSLAAALALPHASFAVGFAFLIAPSGFLARVISPELSGWQEPPDLLIIGDPWALSLLVALSLKETLFLILMITAALGQLPSEALLRTARSFGYSPIRAWLTVIAPQVYRQVRLPIYAVIAASLGSVDLGLVLGPSAPPTLAPLILRWFSDFDLTLQLRAAAGSTVLLALTAVTIGVWRLGERALGRWGRSRLTAGARGGGIDVPIAAWGAGLVGLSLIASLMALIVLALWSFAGQWPWPQATPQSWTISHWTEATSNVPVLLSRTVVIAALSTVCALILALFALEAQAGSQQRRGNAFLFAPLLLPQAGFLFGVTVLWSALRWDGVLGVVVWTHLLFVAPYVYLALRGPFDALDPRLERTARTLGKSRLETLLAVKAPLLLRPLLTAAAIGFTISVTLYLPTIVAGAGRVYTLATETIALSSGGDRRTLGVVALVLAALPFAALGSALALGALAARHRAGLQP